MTARYLLALTALALLVGAGPAFAQEDDDIVPLAPAREKPVKPKRKRKGTPKPPPTAPPEDELVPLKPPAPQASISVNLFTPGPGARLFIDGAEVGPLNPGDPPHPVSPGSHKVMVRRPGFKDFNLNVPTQAGTVAQVPVSLEPVDGVLAVQSDVPHSDVWVDGRKVGEVPLKELVLPPGEHEVQVRREGFEPDTTRLTVRPGKDYQVRAHLKPLLPGEVAKVDRPERPRLTPAAPTEEATPGPLSTAPTSQPAAVAAAGTPWYGQWYVWAGVGAVAAASAVGVVMATQPHALDPNRDVCRPQCSTIVNDPRSGAVPLLRF